MRRDVTGNDDDCANTQRIKKKIERGWWSVDRVIEIMHIRVGY